MSCLEHFLKLVIAAETEFGFPVAELLPQVGDLFRAGQQAHPSQVGLNGGPVFIYGATIEALLGGLRLLIGEEEITDLVVQLGNGKRELGLVSDDNLEEMLKA